MQLKIINVIIYIVRNLKTYTENWLTVLYDRLKSSKTV